MIPLPERIRRDPPGAGRSPRRRRSIGGFTLLEVLLVIALIALLAGVLVGGASGLLNDKPVSADDVFWSAVQEARKKALKAEHEIRLKFDKDKKEFVLIDGLAPTTLGPDGVTLVETPLKELPVPPAGATDLTVDFLSPTKGGGGNTILIGGVLLEAQPIAFVTFYADGTCSPFRAQFARNGAAHILTVDPWTCAAVLTPADQNQLKP
jgi:prepilin-type N-terminal cleavage/methylation domain-containing protein